MCNACHLVLLNSWQYDITLLSLLFIASGISTTLKLSEVYENGCAFFVFIMKVTATNLDMFCHMLMIVGYMIIHFDMFSSPALLLNHCCQWTIYILH